jgi:hypothetical protein
VADIFVSYTSSDKEWAFWIGQELEKLGHTPRIHEWEISGGGDIAAWMEERHQKADHILCVISRVYLTKPYSSWERHSAQWAARTERPNFALPVRIEGLLDSFHRITSQHALIGGLLRCQRRLVAQHDVNELQPVDVAREHD